MILKKEKRELSNTKGIDTVGVNKNCTVTDIGRVKRMEGGNKDEDGEKN